MDVKTLIRKAFGEEPDSNVVNFKLIRFILILLANNVRVLKRYVQVCDENYAEYLEELNKQKSKLLRAQSTKSRLAVENHLNKQKLLHLGKQSRGLDSYTTTENTIDIAKTSDKITQSNTLSETRIYKIDKSRKDFENDTKKFESKEKLKQKNYQKHNFKVRDASNSPRAKTNLRDSESAYSDDDSENIKSKEKSKQQKDQKTDTKRRGTSKSPQGQKSLRDSESEHSDSSEIVYKLNRKKDRKIYQKSLRDSEGEYNTTSEDSSDEAKYSNKNLLQKSVRGKFKRGYKSGKSTIDDGLIKDSVSGKKQTKKTKEAQINGEHLSEEVAKSKGLKIESKISRETLLKKDEIHISELPVSRKFASKLEKTAKDVIHEGRPSEIDKRTTEKGFKGKTMEQARPRHKIGSVEVATHSEFDILKAAVKQLKRMTGPIPKPTMPLDEELKSDILKGKTTVSSTMEVMQLHARIRAAEDMVRRMRGIIASLVDSGILPKDAMKNFVESEFAVDVEKMFPQKKQISHKLHLDKGTVRKVSEEELNEYFATTRNKLMENIKKTVSDIQEKTVKSGENITSYGTKLGDISKFVIKQAKFHEMMNKSENQLTFSRLGNGLEIDNCKSDIKACHSQVTKSINDYHDLISKISETVGVQFIKERYVVLNKSFEKLHEKSLLLRANNIKIVNDISHLLKLTFTLQAQKADYEEMKDLLRDKADISFLSKLVTKESFAEHKEKMDEKITFCLTKFGKQTIRCQEAVNNLTQILKTKVPRDVLLKLKENNIKSFKNLNKKTDDIMEFTSIPRAALITKRNIVQNDLSHEVQGITTKLHLKQKDSKPVVDNGDFCFKINSTDHSYNSKHICQRCTGGSHTIVDLSVVSRQHAEPFPTPVITHYYGNGDDGKINIPRFPKYLSVDSSR